ncbi:MAG: hypothetical protein K8J08_01390 [Thermoanaerobaculia bacterium]|nr:hypothetical protein [Thermoanaerobaculia bacterium]
MPFPHQNLPALGRQLDQPAEVLLAAARLAGADIDGLPRLGGLGLPPSRELAVAASLDGQRAELAIRPYPLLRLGGRAAGALASNPWLEGGAVELSDEEAQVSWQRGGTWVLSKGGAALGEDTDGKPVAGDDPADRWRSNRGSLGRIELRARGLAIPVGVYDLTSSGFGFSLASGLAAAAGSSPESGLDLLSTVDQLAVFRVDGGPTGVMLLVFDGELRRGELPSAAVVSTDRSAALAALPGSRLLGSLGDLPSKDLETGALAGAVVVATDNRGLDLALTQRAAWEPIWKAARTEQASGFWVDLQRSESIAADTADLFEDVPLVPRREARRWRDIHTVVRGFRAFRVASAWWTPDGGALTVE